MSERVEINNNMLRWAIARAGFELNEFAEKFPRILKWLNDEAQPTFKQLQDFANKVYVPLGYLFLENPPEENISFPYFRTLNGGDRKIHINVYDTILNLQQRQDWLKEYLIDNKFEELDFIGKFNNRSEPQDIVNDIRETLDLNWDWASSYRTWTDALNGLVETIEDKGIIVVFNGVVENYTNRKIPVEECRGFVLVDEIAPFMFINNADSKAAQMFTIVHELAHLWTGQSAAFDFRNMQPSDDPIEELCDHVAAEFLVPGNQFREFWQSPNVSIESAGRHFKVSQIVIARRALDLGLITRQQFFDFYNTYIARDFQRRGDSTGGNFYMTARKRISVTFASHVQNAVKTNQLLYRDAYKLTSLKANTYDKFMSEHI